MKTIFVKPALIERKWFIIDAEGKPLGRIAARVAAIVRGKEKAVYVPHQEVGDFVIVINADKIAVSGRKVERKLYHHHTGYVGGLKTTPFEKLIIRNPLSPLKNAIKGMLPKGPLGRKLFLNVKLYAGSKHPHNAQNPQLISL